MSERANTVTALMVSTSYPAELTDWRGLFIRNLVEAMARRNDLHLRLWSPPGEMPANCEYVATASERTWLASLMAAGGIAHLMRTAGARGLAAPIRLLSMLARLYRRELQVDVFHVNWLQNALVLPRTNRPLLTTVLGTDMQLLKLPGMTQLLRRSFRGRRVAICPNAGWMVAELERRFGDLATVHPVPFGIDPCWYALQRRGAADGREKWVCVTRLTVGKIGTLFAWCAPYFADGERELHLFGPMQQTLEVPAWVHYHGAATPDTLCRDWFPQAHGMITLSQHAEGRPQVMLEAMAAGLPIIASRLAAHEDLLDHRRTGWLCGQATDVGEALNALADVPTNAEMGRRARDWVKAEIGTWDDCVERYVRIYQQLVED